MSGTSSRNARLPTRALTPSWATTKRASATTGTTGALVSAAGATARTLTSQTAPLPAWRRRQKRSTGRTTPTSSRPKPSGSSRQTQRTRPCTSTLRTRTSILRTWQSSHANASSHVNELSIKPELNFFVLDSSRVLHPAPKQNTFRSQMLRHFDLRCVIVHRCTWPYHTNTMPL